MGNGGGGTVIFGMDEEPETSIAKCLTPLPSADIVGVIEDIVRSAVSPPLLWSHDTFEADGGCVVVADIEVSPLGPYMVEAYGDQRYYKRSGESVHPMTEQEVRDAYSLAHRSGERRSTVWADHELPMHALNDSPWLVVSAVPEEPLSEILDSYSMDLNEIQSPRPLTRYMSHTGLDFALRAVRHWSEGLAADDGFNDTDPKMIVRLHRDGAAGFARTLLPEIDPEWIARFVNCFLAYLGWLWQEFHLQRPVELEIAVEGLASCTVPMNAFGTASQSVVQPAGLTVDRLVILEEVLPWELWRASVRHHLIRRFSDRLAQAFARSSASALFERGWLFNHLGLSTGLALDRGMIWNPAQGMRITTIDTAGQVRTPSTGSICAYVLDGVVLDIDGHTLATLEMAVGSGCPNGFLPDVTQIVDSPLPQPVEPTDPAGHGKPPDPTGTWSTKTLVETLGQ